MIDKNMFLFLCFIIASFPFGFIIGGILWPLYSGLRKILYVPLIQKRLIKEAVKKGHVIEAVNVGTEGSLSLGLTEVDNSISEQAFFEYEYNGKKYKQLLIPMRSWDRLPQKTILYYQKDPKKACVPSVLGMRENPTWFLQYLILSLILWIFVIIFVYNTPYLQNFFNQ